ncbi:MAG: cell division protein ZapB [Aliarcobacter sp.]|nr:cell division protein ZapB [Aliarcobacter sp.]
MEIIETLNTKIDKLIHDYDKLRLENQALQQELDFLKNENDELIRNNQDMFLRIDSTLTLIKAQNSE